LRKREIIEQLENDCYTRLGVSQIIGAGVGVFAIKFIPKGISPFYGDKLQKKCKFIGIETPELNTLTPEIFRFVQDMNVFDEGKYWLPTTGMESITKSWYLNHSNNPNMYTPDGGEDFVTLRDIQIGEELTINYGTYNYPEDVFER
jgi:hypothetical protein